MEEVPEQSENRKTEKHQFKSIIFNSPEGRMLLAGLAIALFYTLWLGTRVIVSPKTGQILIGMTATEILFGRAAGMAFGYSLGFDNIIVIPICISIETALVLIFYPLFVFTWQQLLVIKWLKRTFDRTRKSAQAHQEIVRKYGIIGLFLLVWFPFWMTGPVVGCVLGYLIGMKTWMNITAVLAGTYVAILGWAIMLRHIHKQVADYSAYAPMIILVVILLIAVIGYIIIRKK